MQLTLFLEQHAGRQSGVLAPCVLHCLHPAPARVLKALGTSLAWRGDAVAFFCWENC